MATPAAVNPSGKSDIFHLVMHMAKIIRQESVTLWHAMLFSR